MEYSQDSFSGMRELRSAGEGSSWGAVSLPRPSWQDEAVRFRHPGAPQRVRRITDGRANLSSQAT
ncbi:hypothetical protein SSP24_26060 [Streptomyces spinoverrucosus]|uniref:Uncharacterized protein n=1 Tax=Streptomyces spinoverrucosus TaxID=284043 RepID=A0A4Y3VH52_9ACTN|nr:hypothetical protein SSP24_26060 [Streptomyces spinoverrucosus]GHB60899.1 hypothetical protein GCM10010397_33900 [Streptomyces spinoverrucosus]